MDILCCFFSDFIFFDLGVSAHPRAAHFRVIFLRTFIRLVQLFLMQFLSAAHSPSGFPLKFRPLNHSRYFHLKFTFYSFVSEYSKIEFAGS